MVTFVFMQFDQLAIFLHNVQCQLVYYVSDVNEDLDSYFLCLISRKFIVIYLSIYF